MTLITEPKAKSDGVGIVGVVRVGLEGHTHRTGSRILKRSIFISNYSAHAPQPTHPSRTHSLCVQVRSSNGHQLSLTFQVGVTVTDV